MKTIKKIELRSRRERVAEAAEPYGKVLSGPEAVAKIAQHITQGEDQEIFLVFVLDVKHKIIGYCEVGRGSFETCPVDVRAVFRSAIHLGASSIICSHNHPSGDPEPSEADDLLTNKLKKASKILDIDFLDHVIVASEGDYSYRAHGKL